MNAIATVVLWIHLFSAVLFIGGSFFMWIVLVPASRQLGLDEAARTVLVGRIARAFARWTNALLVVLVLTGLYNASWYLPSPGLGAILATTAGRLLLVKVTLVAALIMLLYVHGLYYGRRISRLARDRDLEGLARVRRTSRLVSYANLGLMAAILLIVAMMQAWA